MSNPANRKRALERRRCREVLANHISKYRRRRKGRTLLIKNKDDRLGLCVRPSEVRLHPSENDGYAWLFSNATSHLLDRQLSEMSTNMYIEISNGLECGDIRVVCNDDRSQVRTSLHDLEADTHNLEKQLQDSIHTIQKLETEIENYKHREGTLLSQNRRLRQAFTVYLRKARGIGRCLGETERQIHEFLNSMKLKK